MSANGTSTGSIRISSGHLGLGRVSDNPAGAIERANELLQKNHDKYHIFWRDVGGHNHLPHSVLSVLALGGGPDEVQRAFDDGVAIQRPIPPLDTAVAHDLKDPSTFAAHIGDINQYTNYLAFFEQEIAAKGWREVLQEHVFSGTPNAERIFAQLYEGAHHPIIHLGFGVEFELPGIIAEGLAQAAVHDSANLEGFYHESEKIAASANTPVKSLLALYDEVRATPKIATAALIQQGPVRVREGVIARAGSEIAAVAAQWRVANSEEALERAVAESANIAAYSAGAAQRPGKKRRIDFFHMHNVNASIFFTALIRQPWISLADKVKLVERKARTDLVWYAASSAPELRPEFVREYAPTLSSGVKAGDWQGLYKLVNVAQDDGHLAKFVRALKNGEEISRGFETGEGADDFPVKGDAWFRLAQVAYDTTLNQAEDDKWIWGSGFDPLWAKVPAA
ncbi:oxidoreductase AflY [Dichotomopilus funicola]|uniref:Oxidoreductase AflY n=1 Tax=Dichotomopilus funicola TaxID=1934379 RepID=A0AAN6ZJA9_9PEZI|nr:oxidoreductase AflY [Dichotomopilus funicola]